MRRSKNKSGTIKTILLSVIIILLFSPSVFADSGMPVFEAGEGVYLLDPDTGDTYAKQNETKRYYPASTTKLLTALTAMDIIGDKTEDNVTVGKEITMIDADSSVAGLTEGDSYTWKNLLYGLLLPSGNDAAMTIAVNVARIYTGSTSLSENEAIAVFAEMMNQKAIEAGAVDSHFVNPHGLFDENHYTTPIDMAKIAGCAFENRLIRNICQTADYICRSKNSKKHEWVNSNVLLHASAEIFSDYSKEKLGLTDSANPYYSRYATSGKTGYEELAGRCLVFFGTNGEMKLLGVIFKASDMIPVYTQAKTALDNAMTGYAHVKLAEASSKTWVLLSSFFDGFRVAVTSGEQQFLTVPTDEKDSLMKTIEWDEMFFEDKGSFLRLKSSFDVGTQIGTMHVLGKTYENHIPLYAENSMEVIGVADYAMIVFVVLVIVFIVIFMRKKRLSKAREKTEDEKNE